MGPVIPFPSCVPSRAQLVDEFVELTRAVETIDLHRAPKKKRIDELALVIRSWYPDLAPEKTAIAEGLSYDVEVGEKTVEKEWKSMAAVCKAAGGLKAFLRICSVTFKALSAVIGQAKAEALQVEKRTGNRRLKAVDRAKKAA